MADDTCPFEPAGDQRLGPPFQFTSLTRDQRRAIVNRMANHDDPNAAPAQANLLVLSALGASLDIDGHWAPSEINNLAQWRHITSQGRDHYVRVVLRGYLFPVGHQAVRVDIIERVFVVAPQGHVTAYLHKKSFIRVTEPLKTYSPATGQPFEGRGWPLGSVLIADEVSPLIKKDLKPLGGDPHAGFPIRDDNEQPVRWNLIGTDRDGHQVTFSVPLVFVEGQGTNPASVYDEAYTRTLANAYNSLPADGPPPGPDRNGNTGGALLQYAPEEPGRPGATTHPTGRITLGAATTRMDPNTDEDAPGIDRAELVRVDQPAFYPSLDRALATLPAADVLTKKTNGIEIQPYHGYVEAGLANAGKVYAEAIAPAPLKFAGDMVGAVATPNFAVTGLSAVAGAVGGSIDRYASQATVDPAEYFQSVGDLVTGTLLGGLKLSDIIGEMPAPTLVEVKEPDTTEVMFQGPGGVGVDMERRIIRYHLEAELRSVAGVFDPVGGPNGPGNLVLDVVAVFPPTGEPTFDVDGRIDPFVVHILTGPLHFIDIPFNRFRFHSANGAKPDVEVDVGDVVFVGALSFVNELSDLLKVLGESGLLPESAGQDSASAAAGPSAAAEGPGSSPPSGPFVNVTPSAIDAGVTVALPAIVVGVFNMQNLALTAAVHVPFTEAPAAARFAFSSREHPFLLTVMAFGGGGFVGLGLSLNRVELVEASLEFGAQIAFDIGIASGGVTVSGGVYFKFEADKGVELTGFVRITGALEVLGLVAISAEFNLALTYRSKPDPNGRSAVAGTATLRVEIDIAFFSVTKELTVTKEFAGGDPTFRDMIPDQPTWAAYCGAFAG
ncbi:MAG: hypothetical protein M3179_06685 [Actinomycetota bacterium]|nr:hypothetical protein [Actinomycetota bacterium]